MLKSESRAAQDCLAEKYLDKKLPTSKERVFAELAFEETRREMINTYDIDLGDKFEEEKHKRE